MLTRQQVIQLSYCNVSTNSKMLCDENTVCVYVFALFCILAHLGSKCSVLYNKQQLGLVIGDFDGLYASRIFISKLGVYMSGVKLTPSIPLCDLCVFSAVFT